MNYEAQLIESGKCPQLVPVWTEDGTVDGRCMEPITDKEWGLCASHSEEMRQWRNMSEFEKAQWERKNDEENF